MNTPRLLGLGTCGDCGRFARLYAVGRRVVCEQCINEHRPDSDDLTPLVRRLSQHERDEHTRLRWQARACWVFWGFAIAASLIVIVWGLRQLVMTPETILAVGGCVVLLVMAAIWHWQPHRMDSGRTPKTQQKEAMSDAALAELTAERDALKAQCAAKNKAIEAFLLSCTPGADNYAGGIEALKLRDALRDDAPLTP